MRFNNRSRENARRPITKVCPVCDQPFETKTGAKSSTFCSRSCASKGSMSEDRRESMRRGGRKAVLDGQGPTIEKIAMGLRTREGWKYAEVRKLLEAAAQHHTFEWVLPGTDHIFDLAIHARQCLIEFDGAYHTNPLQKTADQVKDQAALQQGWAVTRILVPNKKVISAALVFPFIS